MKLNESTMLSFTDITFKYAENVVYGDAHMIIYNLLTKINDEM